MACTDNFVMGSIEVEENGLHQPANIVAKDSHDEKRSFKHGKGVFESECIEKCSDAAVINEELRNCLHNVEEPREAELRDRCESSDCDAFSDIDEEVEKAAPSAKKQKLTLHCEWVGCKKVFHKRRYLEDHHRCHTGERPFICEYLGCHKAYTKKEHLMRHQRTHYPGTPKFSCPQCSQTYSTNANLSRHINRTHNEARFKCTVAGCEMSFKKNWQLKNHLSKVHSSVKPFVCTHENCKREFSYKSHFNRHMKSHKGYDCKIEGCDAHFDTSSLVREHVVKFHNPEHTCTTCGKTFPARQYKAHLRRHKQRPEQRESFFCTYPDCHRVYFDKKNLDTHIRVFHEKAKFECTYKGCFAKLVSKQKLLEHMVKIHDPVYVKKQKLLHKKKRKLRMQKYRKEKAVNEVMNLLLNKTEVKYCATTRREFEGRELGNPEKEVAIKVVNEPGRPSLMDIVSEQSGNKNCDESHDSEENGSDLDESHESEENGSSLDMSFSENEDNSDWSEEVELPLSDL